MINIYLISSEINDIKLYKIGITRRSIEKRIKEFQTGSVSEFIIVDSFKSKWAFKIESTLHKFHKTKRVKGEWFDLNENDIDGFKSMCEMLHSNFEIIENSNTYYIDRGGKF